jgi:K(+)-stimulated pyrophosphate-energized sodium pump
MDLIIFTTVSAISALAFAGYLAWNIFKKETGTAHMREISDAIREGSKTYLKRQTKTAAVFIAVLASVLFFTLGSFTAFAFILGVAATALAGYIGMSAAVRANARTANSAKASLGDALKIAFRGGAINGLFVVGLGLLGISMLYSLNPNPIQLFGFGFGSSVMALFARVGGGIFTKAADIGADLVGKIEVGIPEDDPRNPAVIADNVGDNVGDVAGMGSDLFQSSVSTLIACMVAGVMLGYGMNGVILPLLMGVAGVLATILGILMVRTGGESPLWAINKGLFTAGIVALVIFYFATQLTFGSLNIFYAIFVGTVKALFLALVVQYYTSYNQPPTREIAKAAQSGAAVNILTGLAAGFMSTAPIVIIIAASILTSYYFAGLYGVLLAALGMHAITGMTVAIDSYGPITDNASGIVEMANLGSETRETTERLDSVGNTTKTMCKIFAITDATLSELTIFIIYFVAIGLTTISITEANVVVGLLIGGALPFILSSLCLKAVGNAAFKMIHEVRRQFREIKGLMRGKAKPDYVKCIDISTNAALKGMAAPVILAITTPLAIGLTLGVEALGGLLAGSIVSAMLIATFMANVGGAWDNAKKYIEAGHLGGMGTPTHAAAVVGDMVGDPFKDTAGPSLDILISVMNTIALLFAQYFI